MIPALARATRTRRAPLVLPVLVLPVLVAGAIVSTAAPARAAAQIAPVLECVALNTDGSFTAVFGTDNETGGDVVIPIGKKTNGKWSNAFDGMVDRGQPTLILAGRQPGAFTVTSPDGAVLRWELGDHLVTANRNDRPCSDQPAVPDVPAAVLGGVAALLGAGLGLRRTRRSGADPAA